MSCTRLISMIMIVLTAAATGQAQEVWEVAKERKGVTIYTRTLPDFPIKEYRADIEVDASLQQVINFFSDTEYHAEWMEGVERSMRVEGTPTRLYYILALPFPFKNRYMWLAETIESDADQHTIRLYDTPGEITKGLIQIPTVQGFWEFTKIEGNRTHIRQQFVTDPGGEIPDWVVNLFVLKNPYKTMKNLRASLDAQVSR